MRVLGIDPGSRMLGWGVVERHGTRLCHVAHGVINAGKGELCGRLVIIDEGLRNVLEEHKPAAAAVEAMFFAKNAQSAATLGHARGVVLLCVSRAGLSPHEYPPARVKRAVVGRGRGGQTTGGAGGEEHPRAGRDAARGRGRCARRGHHPPQYQPFYRSDREGSDGASPASWASAIVFDERKLSPLSSPLSALSWVLALTVGCAAAGC